ncbi:MAG: helix-turn-helix domain-containing protein [Muribaculaceae bacterium]|nr:helix-turn-helix domain-containing protein [Muribaculaceae bacterium]
MYKLKDWWNLTMGPEPTDDWDGKVLCTESNARMTRRTNITQGFLACYTFTLVTRGWLTMNYNGAEIKIERGDLYIYSPGLAVAVIDSSADYRSICLMVDESTTLESPSVHDMVTLAYQPLVQLSQPKLSLTAEQAAMFEARMHEMIAYQHSNNIFKDKLLRMLYAVFLFDLQNVQEKVITQRHVPQRVEEIFVKFNRLLPRHFIEHRNIAFYADRLCITADYLSRIVKRVSGRTVIDFINQMLMMEASYLLSTTSLSVSQIASQLHFAEPAAFTHFFSRLKGMSPRAYREKNRIRIHPSPISTPKIQH